MKISAAGVLIQPVAAWTQTEAPCLRVDAGKLIQDHGQVNQYHEQIDACSKMR